MGNSGQNAHLIEAVERLIPIQFGIIFDYLSDQSKTVYVGQWQGTFAGKLDPTALDAAWRNLVKRHTILRTSFEWELKNEPLQIVIREVRTALDVIDLRSFGDIGIQNQRVEQFLQDDRARGFELNRSPLMRLTILRLADDSQILVWTRHHLICDGWSLATMFGELFELYAAICSDRKPELPPAVPHIAYVKWWNEHDKTEARRFWSNYLQPINEIELHGKKIGDNRPIYKERTKLIGSVQLSAVKDYCRIERITLNTLIKGAWGLILTRWRGSDQMIFGTTEALRAEELDDLGTCLGPQINTLPVLIDTWDKITIGDWLRALQSSAAKARLHGRLSLPEIAASCGLDKGQSLFDSIVVFQNYPMQGIVLPSELNLRLKKSSDVSIPGLPITLIIEPADELTCRLIYDCGHLPDLDAGRLLDDLESALLQMCAMETSELRSFDFPPMLIPAAALSDQHPSADGSTILNRIGAVPNDAIALVWGERQVSYGTLRDQVFSIAAAIQDHFGTGKRIGLFCTHSIESIILILGTLWSGNAYVPLDHASPPKRLSGMIGDADLCAVICDPAIDLAQLGTIGSTRMVPYSALRPKRSEKICLPLPRPDTLAYIIFTSGSTGRPKGVAVGHRSLLAIIDVRPDISPGPFSGVLLTFPLVFDGSVNVIFSTLASGETLVLPDPAPELDPIVLCRTIARTRLTHIVMVPGLYTALIDAAEPGQLDSLKVCAVAGEACERHLVQKHYATLPNALLVNEYGPTETTVVSCAYRCSAGGNESVAPIGGPIRGTWIYLLDRHKRLVPPGTAGEIFIGGRGVTWGYIGNTALTAERFGPDPWSCEAGSRMYQTGDLAMMREDGAFIFLGRSDQQIKLHGYRIEPGEVELALRELPNVAEALVVAHRSSATSQKLIAYVAGKPGMPSLDKQQLQKALAAKLPNYMIPQVMTISALPRLVSGKIDRNALPDPAEIEDETEISLPQSKEEAVLAAIWCEVFDCTSLPATKDFFELGGTSIMGMRLVARIRAELGAKIELHDLFRSPTIRSLALVAAQSREREMSMATPIPRRERQPRLYAGSQENV